MKSQGLHGMAGRKLDHFVCCQFFWVLISVHTITMFGVFDRTSRTGLLFVSLSKIRVHGTDASEKTLLVVVRPRLHPFGEQLDAALEQAERTTVLFAQALHDRQQTVDGAVVGSEPVHQHRQEVAAFQFAPLAEPLQQVTDLRDDGRRVRVTGRRVGHHHGRRGRGSAGNATENNNYNNNKSDGRTRNTTAVDETEGRVGFIHKTIATCGDRDRNNYYDNDENKKTVRVKRVVYL